MESRQDAQSTSRLVSCSRRMSASSVAAVFGSGFEPDVVWRAAGEPAVVGVGAAVSVSAGGPSALDAVRADAAAVLESASGDVPAAARPRFLGGVAFHDGHDAAEPWSGFPGVAFRLPRVQFVLAEDATHVTVSAYGDGVEAADVRAELDAVLDRFDADRSVERPAKPGVVAESRTVSRETWREQVRTVVERIERGDLEKAVLAQALDLDLGADFPLAGTLDRLAADYPDCHQFAVRGEDGAVFFGASPERLVARRDSRLETGALAATVPRGGTPEEDAALEAELRSSEKLVHEHEVVADSIRDQLASVARNVRTGDRGVRKLASVQHLFTPIAADTDRHVLDLVDALHPTPAVGGRPPDVALEAIREAEAFDRGWYAAPVGWFDAAGDGTFAVAIRSGLADGRDAHLYAGAGIVADSDPDAEWEEIQLKFRSVRNHLAR